MIPPERYRGGRAENVWWKRGGKRRANGAWGVGWRQKTEKQVPSMHSRVDIEVYDSQHQRNLVEYLKAASLHGACDLGFLDADTDRYRPFAKEADIWSGGLSLNTHVLRHWLPDIFWGTVLGPAYVSMFGRDRVLDSPAHVVEELSHDMIYLQLTPRLEDVEERFDVVMQVRQRVKEHLGGGAFFCRDKAEREYPYKPLQLGPGATYIPALPYNRNDHPEKAGKVFRTPEFHLLPG